jgi:hypothetical protein
MNFKQYVDEATSFYNYRIKTICILDDNAMDWLERVVLKYDPVDISKPRKLMLQKAPLDFTNVPVGSEVWMVDIQTALPVSSYVLQKELQLALGLPETHVVVRGANDPVEIENERKNAEDEIDKEAAAKGMTRDALLNDPDYTEADHDTPELYGDDYNGRLLGYLRTVQKEREGDQKIDAPNAKFGWLNMPKPDVADDNGAYNSDIAGAPTIGQPGDGQDLPTAPQGNLSGHKRTYRRLYGKDGARSTISRDMDTTKDPK